MNRIAVAAALLVCACTSTENHDSFLPTAEEAPILIGMGANNARTVLERVPKSTVMDLECADKLEVYQGRSKTIAIEDEAQRERVVRSVYETVLDWEPARPCKCAHDVDVYFNASCGKRSTSISLGNNSIEVSDGVQRSWLRHVGNARVNEALGLPGE